MTNGGDNDDAHNHIFSITLYKKLIYIYIIFEFDSKLENINDYYWICSRGDWNRIEI